MMEETKDFETILLEAIDEGLRVLGEGGKHMVFFYLERNYSIRKQDIPRNLEAFAFGLEKIFGAGAPVLEKMILKCIYSKLGLKYKEKEGQQFIDCIKKATQTVQTAQTPRASQAMTHSSGETEKQDADSNLTPQKKLEGCQAADEGQPFGDNGTFETFL